MPKIGSEKTAFKILFAKLSFVSLSLVEDNNVVADLGLNQ